MAVSDDRKYTKAFVHSLLEGIKGKTLGEVDKSHQFARTEKSEKITGIAGDVIEQSVFMCTDSTNNQNNNPIFLPRRTNCMTSLLYDQTIVFLNHRQTNVLTSESLQQATNCTHVHCLGPSSTLRASAPS